MDWSKVAFQLALRGWFLAVLALVWASAAQATSLYDCAGAITNTCNPRGASPAFDTCQLTAPGVWTCFTAYEPFGAPETSGANINVVYDATAATCGAADSYIAYGTDNYGATFCCWYPAANIFEVDVNTGKSADTIFPCVTPA